MSLSFIAGNLLGRAAVSYLIVLGIAWFCSGLCLSRALSRSRRWYSLLAVAGMTLLGMAAAVSRAGGAG